MASGRTEGRGLLFAEGSWVRTEIAFSSHSGPGEESSRPIKMLWPEILKQVGYLQ